jgi:hypothetical protein
MAGSMADITVGWMDPQKVGRMAGQKDPMKVALRARKSVGRMVRPKVQ